MMVVVCVMVYNQHKQEDPWIKNTKKNNKKKRTRTNQRRVT